MASVKSESVDCVAPLRNDGKKKGRDRSRPFGFASLVTCEAYFASARLGGVAGHDFTSVS